MNYVGNESLLDAVQLAELNAHLQKDLHLIAESVARWVKERWGGGATPGLSHQQTLIYSVAVST